jgi:hypothetical protein
MLAWPYYFWRRKDKFNILILLKKNTLFSRLFSKYVAKFIIFLTGHIITPYSH